MTVLTSPRLRAPAAPAQRQWTAPEILPGRYPGEVRRVLKVLDALRRLQPSDLCSRHFPVRGRDLVSVIIPMRNARRWIDLCLKGLLAQTHRNIEVFCVDDHSEDDSYGRVVDRFGRDRRLAAFRLERRVGPYQIKNWIITQLARGQLVALQDADDVSHPTRLAEQAAWMRRYRLRVCGTCIHQFFPRGMRPRRGSRILVTRGRYRHSLAVYPPVPMVRGPANFEGRFGDRSLVLAKHGSQVFEREVLLEFGGFDGHSILGADTDLNWRLLRYMDVGNVPKVLYSRRFHRDSLTRHPATGQRSRVRRDYLAARERLQAQIVQALARGDQRLARELATADLWYGDLAVAEYHSGFAIKGL